MTKKIVLGVVSLASMFSATAFAANPLKSMFSNGPKGFIGGSVNGSNIGEKTTEQMHALGAGITGGFVYEVGKNNIVADLSFDLPITNYKMTIEEGVASGSFKSKYGISAAIKYAFNVFDNAKAYAGVSLHSRKYTLTARALDKEESNSKTMLHIAAVLGMEAKVASKVGFFGELHYFVAGGKGLTENSEKINKGNMMKIGARYYF